jgi:hypothetical protein
MAPTTPMVMLKKTLDHRQITKMSGKYLNTEEESYMISERSGLNLLLMLRKLLLRSSDLTFQTQIRKKLRSLLTLSLHNIKTRKLVMKVLPPMRRKPLMTRAILHPSRKSKRIKPNLHFLIR